MSPRTRSRSPWSARCWRRSRRSASTRGKNPRNAFRWQCDRCVRSCGRIGLYRHSQGAGVADQTVPSDLALRVKSLESLLVEKGLVDREALDALIDAYEHKIGPRNGARVVARAWVDPAYKQ